MENKTIDETKAAAAEAAIRTLKSFARSGNEQERAASDSLQVAIWRWVGAAPSRRTRSRADLSQDDSESSAR